jgi:hypothetical protein
MPSVREDGAAGGAQAFGSPSAQSAVEDPVSPSLASSTGQEGVG